MLRRIIPGTSWQIVQRPLYWIGWLIAAQAITLLFGLLVWVVVSAARGHF